jgi:hypothetical protein
LSISSEYRAGRLVVVALAIIACQEDGPGNQTFGVDPPSTGATDSQTGGPDDGTDTDSMQATGDGTGTTGATSGGSTGDMPPDGEHALGTILLGETHPVGTGDALAILSASFVPDASVAPQSCAMDVDGCMVTIPLDCAPSICTAEQICAFDDNCMPTCQTACNLACAADEVCYFPFPDAPACRKVEPFDAGRLDIVGTLSPITLYPPYSIPAGVEGPLAQPDREITAMASGATQAGFAAFEATTTSMDSVFSTIDEILPTEAFGAGDLPIEWLAGADEMTITVTVTGMLGFAGTVVCEADDTTGAFSVPRAALTAAIPDDTATTYAISLQRSRTETTMGLETVGTLLDHTVQPVGWVDFTYTSIETGSIINM